MILRVNRGRIPENMIIRCRTIFTAFVMFAEKDNDLLAKKPTRRESYGLHGVVVGVAGHNSASMQISRQDEWVGRYPIGKGSRFRLEILRLEHSVHLALESIRKVSI